MPRTFIIVATVLLLGATRIAAQQHWAYEPPKRAPLPNVPQTYVPRPDWPQSPLDRFVRARMADAALEPTNEASREQLIRRVTLALTGLPPTLDEIDDFLTDNSPDAYERVVDRLAASPAYGERVALMWLDLARYADTHGYHTDAHRDMWRWRDWVVEAFNQNMPFDQFTIWQLAGDRLPEPSIEQRLATGFNRNNMVNSEDGAIAEEYRTQYVADRVATTATVWMGQTLDCARCHDHKYDPFTQRDYYQFFALFNNMDENVLDGRRGNAAPWIDAPTRLQHEELATTTASVVRFERAMQARASAAAGEQRVWEQRAATEIPAPPTDMTVYLPLDRTGEAVWEEPASQSRVVATGPTTYLPGRFNEGLLLGGETHLELRELPATRSDRPLSLSVWVRPTTADTLTIASRTRRVADEQHGWSISLSKLRPTFSLQDGPDNTLQISAMHPLKLHRWQHVSISYDGSQLAAGVAIRVDGKPLESNANAARLATTFAIPDPLWIGRAAGGDPFRGLLDDLRLFDRPLTPSESAALAGTNPVEALLAIPREQRDAQQTDMLRAHYLEQLDAQYRRLAAEANAARSRLETIRRGISTAMVMQERSEPRTTFVLERGDYRLPAEPVQPGMLESLLPPTQSRSAANRLDLARWLVDPRHPLTARVAVNHFWQLHFGRGLVATPEDFGTRGQPPSHPELLDWLALELIRSGWDIKALNRQIVTSATFRQSSQTTPERRASDPDNVWLARGPAVRLPAEAIRDAALAAAGLLDQRLGGAGVRPYQPAGLWEELSFDPTQYSAQTFTASTGAELYRRSLYTFWKRALPAPAMSTFDAPDRTVCAVRRDRTSTPLQALVLMNDPTFVEAARMIAHRALRDSSGPPELAPELAIERMFRLITARRPSAEEAAVLSKLYDQQLAHYRQQPEAAVALLSVGESPMRPEMNVASWAAATVVASSLLQLDETLTP